MPTYEKATICDDDEHAAIPLASYAPERLLLPHVLLIEDDPALGAMAEEMLSADYRVTWASNGAQARKALESDAFDVWVVDRRLPDMDGLDLVREHRRNGLATPALILTALSEVDDIVEGLDSGANDYLTKPFHFAELEARLRTLLRGFRSQAAAIPIGDWMLKPDSALIEDPDEHAIALTETEVRLLTTLAAAPDHVFSRDELLHTVFSADAAGGAVDVYVSYVRGKTTRALIETVRGRGYRIGNPEME